MSAECCGELVTVVVPPASPAAEAFVAAGSVPQSRCVGVACGEASSGGGLDDVHRIIDGVEKVGSPAVVESVGVGEETEPSRIVSWLPSEAGSVDVVVEGDAE